MIDETRLAKLLEDRSPDAVRELGQIFRWMSQLDRRVCKIEATLEDLANQASDQDHKLSILCTVLKELDDPYGFGRSLDERVFGDADSDFADDSND
jgi:hypothetical protein